MLHDGQLVGAWHSDGQSRPIEAMSVTKSIVNLAIGRLVTLGALESIDVPVSRFYPEWSTGRKARVTIRHLLNHTSGIEAGRTTEEIYASNDFVRLALDAEITSEPGSRFLYNNKAVNLLAGIVEKATGKKMDDFLRDDLFARLGITDFGWSRDPTGNPHAMAGLQIHAMDLAKLGQLVLDRGHWQGEQLIAESWFDESLRPGSPHEATSGLLWWLIPAHAARVIDDAKIQELREAGVDSAFVAAIARVRGRYESPDSFFAALAGALGENWRSVVSNTLGPLGLAPARIEQGPIIGYRAEGYLGQYIVIFPEKRLVAVRMVEPSPSYDPRTDGFPNFSDLVRALVP
ncbi:MAG TPA: serine hydrolase [Longimicrobiales bacterium]